MKTWTRDTVAEAIRAWHRQHGRAPTADDWRDKLTGCPTHSVVTNLFGSWAAAREYAGVPAPPRRRRQARPRREIARELRRLADELDGITHDGGGTDGQVRPHSEAGRARAG